MSSICRFIPAKNDNGTLKTVHFVYETEHTRLHWPQVQPIYYLFLVARGTGTLTLPEYEAHPIEAGSLFLIPAGVRYRIEGSEELSYCYISFMGTRATELVAELQITMKAPGFRGFEGLIPLWKQSIQRLNLQNANLLTESVLLYTLSYLAENQSTDTAEKGDTVFQSIVAYLDNNYCDPTVNLKKVADIFGYTDKYLSHLFKSKMKMNWTAYLNHLRIQHAIELLERGYSNIAELSSICGYTDPLYFSKVFKKTTGKTPHHYQKTIL